MKISKRSQSLLCAETTVYVLLVVAEALKQPVQLTFCLVRTDVQHVQRLVQREVFFIPRVFSGVTERTDVVVRLFKKRMTPNHKNTMSAALTMDFQTGLLLPRASAADRGPGLTQTTRRSRLS